MENIFEKLQRLSEEDLAEIAEVDSSELDEFDEDDVYDPRGPEFEKLMFELFKELNSNIHLTEAFKNNEKLRIHYEDHCLANNPKHISSRNTVYYDFNNIHDYSQREIMLSNKALGGDGIGILSLQDVDYVMKAFRKLFEGNCTLLFSKMCGLTDADGNSVGIVLNSFATDATTNYLQNTVDYLVIKNNRTSTLFPLDINYLQNKFNNIVKKSFPELTFPINGPHGSNKYL